MLQQTKVDQVVGFYKRFLDHFPNVFDLASASEQEVLKCWQGLGYYSRARNIHRTAKIVSNDLGGVFPGSYDALLDLPGIGDYTASAIASIAFGRCNAVVDGNVYRVLSRFFGIEVPIDTGAGRKYFKELAEELIDESDPANYNQAIMEFGAVQCLPRNPNCTSCPLVSACCAHKHGDVLKLPVKEKKVAVRNRYFLYLVVKTEDGFFIRQRSSNDVWAKMFDFPLVELDSRPIKKEIFNIVSGQLNWPMAIANVVKMNKHILSHQHIYAWFAEVVCSTGFDTSDWINVRDIAQLEQYPFPRLVEKYLECTCFLGNGQVVGG